MAKFFTKFPILMYDLTGNSINRPMAVRNIFFRLKLRDAIQSNLLVFYPYYVKDGDTPEIIAYKYYKDSELHWLVMMANDIINPFFDWPMDYKTFVKYIESKYGSVEIARNQIHSYIVTKKMVNNTTKTEYTTSYEVDVDTYTNMAQNTFETIILDDGSSVSLTTTTEIEYAYEHEVTENENKKQIKLVSKDYLDQIKREFDDLAKNYGR